MVPKTRLNIALGAVLCLILAVAGGLLLDNMRDTVRFPDQLSRRFGVNSLGSIFRWSPQGTAGNQLVLLTAPTSSYSEAFRQLRANVQFATANRPNKTLMVASPGPEEGKSTVISNLAVAIAHTGKRVAIIDGDLRRPTVHKLFSAVNRDPGLSNYLADVDAELSSVIQASDVDGVDVISGGPSPPNPSELLGSPKMAAMLEQLSQQYDAVLLDSPPVLLVADGSIMASQVDGVVVVVDGFKTRSSSLKAAVETLLKTNVDILGVVTNKLKPSRFGYGYIYPYHYYYYSNYSYYAESEKAQVNGNTNGGGTAAENGSANGNGKVYGRIASGAKTMLAKLKGVRS